MGRQKKSFTPNAGEPRKPTNLSESAALEWDRLMCEIRDAGLQITPAHRAAVEMASTILADIKTDWAELKAEGSYHVSPKGGIVAHPALKRMDALRRDLAKFLAILGLRPGTSSGDTEETSLDEQLND